jgi:hypothetical protein
MYNCVITVKLTQTLLIAYWIAFGPHGPRAVDPPGTGARVAWGVFIGLAASVALFGAIRAFAKPAPYTMTQEYQEETNEFLKVCSVLSTSPLVTRLTRNFRTKNPILSPVSPLLVMLARVWSSLPPRVTKFNSQHRFLCDRSWSDSTETY